MVSALDEAIGNITDQLRESGMYDDTLIVFTSDVSQVHILMNDDVNHVQIYQW